MPMLLAPDGRRLSKRDRDLDLGQLRKVLHPQELIGALAFSAGLLDRPEPIGAWELAALFSWQKLQKEDFCLELPQLMEL